jgi:branched-chain amino acid aminotransferase
MTGRGTATWLAGHRLEPSDEPGGLLRAVRYGDGIFATLRIEEGRLLDAERHSARLTRGADQLELDPPEGFEDEATIPDRLATIASDLAAIAAGTVAVERRDGVLRCQWSAAGESRGYGRDRRSVALVEFSPTPAPRNPVLRILPDGAVPPPAMPGIKSCNAIPHVLAARHAMRLGVDEVVRMHQGRITEGAASNLFFEQDGRLRTPADVLPLYPGVVRERVIEAAAEIGIEVEEGEWTPGDLLNGQGALLTNSVRGVEVVSRVDDREFGPTPLIRALADSVRASRHAGATPIRRLSDE